MGYDECAGARRVVGGDKDGIVRHPNNELVDLTVQFEALVALVVASTIMVRSRSVTSCC
jgi:hypothetical protein